MGIFSRISDIFKANVNDALDAAEDPEKMLRQMVLEMEGVLSKLYVTSWESHRPAVGQCSPGHAMDQGVRVVAIGGISCQALRTPGEWSCLTTDAPEKY